MSDTIIKGDTVRSNLTGGEYEVIDVVGDIVLGRPFRESYDGNVWVTNVTLVKRASEPELPVVPLTNDDRQLIANIVNDAGYPTLAHKLAPAGAPGLAVGDWFKSPAGRVYQVTSVATTGLAAGGLASVYFNGGNSERIVTVLNEWTKVEVTDA